MVNVVTLFAFLLVPGGVITLRRTRPDLPRAAAADRAGVRVRLADGQPNRRDLSGFTNTSYLSRHRTQKALLSNLKV
jgi:hypothetical protein